jgi:two-component system, NtrC family, sensor histidine kinase HydH
MKPDRFDAARVRWGWLATTCTLGAGLILLSWANYRGARDATQALYWGQSRLITEGAFRDIFRGAGVSPNQEDLNRLLAERKDEGLRYVGTFDSTGRILSSAGIASSAISIDVQAKSEDHGPSLTQVGSRLRMTFLPPPGPASDSLGAEGASARLRPRPRRSGVVLEFEPLIATRLLQRSTRLLYSGIAAAAVMMVAASIFWRLSRRYEQARHRMEEEHRLSILGQMSAVLAHEIRNPLASLKGHAQLLSEHLPAETADRRKADLVVLEATRLELLASDLLEFARIGSLDLGVADPAELVRSCAEEVAPGGFELNLAAAPPRWRLDGPRLRRALTNILRNAKQANPAGSPPLVRVATVERQLVITIRDHGQGLPPGQEDRIFDPFFTTRASGTGLGLSVARRIVELHKGVLSAANHQDGGAILEIVLPNGKD